MLLIISRSDALPRELGEDGAGRGGVTAVAFLSNRPSGGTGRWHP
jgi:hypothetical protein